MNNIEEETLSEISHSEASIPDANGSEKTHDTELAETTLSLEVVYGTPKVQKIVTVDVNEGTSVQSAIEQSGILLLFTDIDLSVNKVGIWNRTAKLTDVVSDLDRIEIYRPLLADPKEVRKRRAEKAKAEGRADKVTGGRVNPLRNNADK